jgi:inner membrane protein
VDTLTHALSGALVARLTAPRGAPPRTLPRRVAAGLFACAFPDIDFVVTWLGPVEYLLHHRGATHSVVLLPLWAFVCAGVLAKLLREPGGWRMLYGVCAWGIGTHIAGDLITSYGTIIFAPLSDARLGWGTTFIIDLWFSAIIVAGLAASALWRDTRAPAAAAVTVLVAYVGFQGLLKARAIDYGVAHAQALGIPEAQVEAYPRPVSPFNWTVFVSDAREHRFAHVNLVRETPRAYLSGDGFIAMLDAAYSPVALARWESRSRYGNEASEETLGRAAWESPALDFLRWFAEKPAFEAVTEGSTCVWFVDLRFVTPGRDWVPFRYGACRQDPQSPWQAYQRAAEGARTPVR